MHKCVVNSMGSSHPSSFNQPHTESQETVSNTDKSEMGDEKSSEIKLKREAEEKPAVAPRSKAQRKNPPKYNSGARLEETEMRIVGRPINSLNTKSSSRPNVAKHSSQEKDVSHSSYMEVAANHPVMGPNIGFAITDSPGVYIPGTGAPEFITVEPGLPTSNGIYRDVEDEYHEVLMGLLQAIHNQNQIMEECRNILKSIHNVMTNNPQVEPVPPLPQEVDLGLGISSYTPLHPSNANNNNNNNNNNNAFPVANEAPKPNQEAPIATQTATPAPAPVASESSAREPSVSRDPDKPQVYGTDGEFSCTYLRHIFGKSSTATSFANVLMKEIFTLEERISSNCNGVMGKKALDSVRLEKIKRAVKRFYADSEADFQDLWKKCRKSIDSTNRNLKFIIMKRPNYIDS